MVCATGVGGETVTVSAASTELPVLAVDAVNATLAVWPGLLHCLFWPPPACFAEGPSYQHAVKCLRHRSACGVCANTRLAKSQYLSD